ncbi:MAG: tRNA1(Val) (adenine(37)-N6)-methyltransferase [Thermodesulfovibrionales bacterium]|nr:tRNA1(Val) (adenine(37)-N6)-methyltransferase [Thermodesulfovibrionales bacterium]
MKTLDFIRDIQFYQHTNGYRVSVDAVLLYDFVRLPHIKTIYDLGAGSGIIGLLLAKRYPNSRVTLVEIQSGLAELANENVTLNRLNDRVIVINSDIKNLSKYTDILGKIDVVVSNPPFRRCKTGLISPNDEKALARHEINLSLSQLLKTSADILKHHGHLYIIYLPERLAEITIKMKENQLEIKRIRFVHSFIDSPAKMVLVEAVKGAKTGLKVMPPLIIYKDKDTYSDEVLEMYMEKSKDPMASNLP